MSYKNTKKFFRNKKYFIEYIVTRKLYINVYYKF